MKTLINDIKNYIIGSDNNTRDELLKSRNGCEITEYSDWVEFAFCPEGADLNKDDYKNIDCNLVNEAIEKLFN